MPTPTLTHGALLTHRALKKARTRDALVAAADALFQQHGYQATTVEAIAEAAEVSRRTFFRYFASKEAVVFPNQQARLERFRALLADAPRDRDPFEAVRQACRGMVDMFSDAREELVSQQRLIDTQPVLIAKERELDRAWEAAIAEALTARWPGTARARRRSRLVAAATMAALRAALSEWYDSEGQADLVKLGEEAFDLLARGVSATAGKTVRTGRIARAKKTARAHTNASRRRKR